METLKQSYDSIMSMPVTRRYRMIMKKNQLEQDRQRKNK